MRLLRSTTGHCALLVTVLTFLLISIAATVQADPSLRQLRRQQLNARRAAITPIPQPPQYAPGQQQNQMFPRQATATVAMTVTTDPNATYSLLPTSAVAVDRQPQPTTTSDPLLALMPDFAFSMPAQIVVDGINIALISVLLIHLLFTVQYHFPLSRKNFYLQISSSLMLLISLSVTLHVVLQQLEDESQRYPFMFPYIGIQLPPGDDQWTRVQEVFFLLMRAITTALIHITHIQFLTLLFPSALEARLILWMLGPLAIINSGMEFTSLADDSDAKTNDLGDAIRNICNSTLTLLYTTALLIWGLLVNRRRAWRAGGGTASFGGGSVGLALINTAISFTEIKYDRLWWLPNVCWTLTIWQSWLGFWWWVSSGMGIGEVEDRQERLERKRKREERRSRKLEKQKQKLAMFEADNAHAEAHSSQYDSSSIPGLNGFRRIKDRLVGDSHGNNTLTRRNRRPAAPSNEEQDARAQNGSATDEIELDQIRVAARDERRASQLSTSSPDGPVLTGIAVHRSSTDSARLGAEGQDSTDAAVDGEADVNAANEDGRTTAGTGSASSDTNPTASSAPGWVSTAAQRFMDHQPNFIKARFRRLRLAHMAAARRAAHEQSALREQVLNSSRVQGPGLRHMMMNRPDSARSGMDSNIDMPELSATPGRSAYISTQPMGEGKTISTTSSLRAAREPRSQSTDATIVPQQRRGSMNQRSSTVVSRGRDGRIDEDDDNDRDSSARGQRSSSGSRSSHRQNGRQNTSRPVSPLSSPQLAATGTRNDTSHRAAAPARASSSLRPRSGAPAVGTRDEEWQDLDDVAGNTADTNQTRGTSSSRTPGAAPSRGRDDGSDDEDGEDSSWFWRGGLRQMRLRDRTTYD